MMTIGREEEYQVLRSFLRLASENLGSTSELVRCAVEESLTPRQRQLVEMYYIRQMPMHYIARELNLNVSTVSRTLARAKARLERCLKYGGRNFAVMLEN